MIYGYYHYGSDKKQKAENKNQGEKAVGQHKSFITLPGGHIKPARNRHGGPQAEKGRKGWDKYDPIAMQRKAERGPRLLVHRTEPGVLGCDAFGVDPRTPLAAASYNGNGHIRLLFLDGRKALLSLDDKMAIAV